MTKKCQWCVNNYQQHVILDLFITLAEEKFTLSLEYESQVLALSCALDVPD